MFIVLGMLEFTETLVNIPFLSFRNVNDIMLSKSLLCNYFIDRNAFYKEFVIKRVCSVNEGVSIFIRSGMQIRSIKLVGVNSINFYEYYTV